MRACLNHFFLGRVYPGPMTPQNERMVPYVAPQAIMLNGITPMLPVQNMIRPYIPARRHAHGGKSAVVWIYACPQIIAVKNDNRL